MKRRVGCVAGFSKTPFLTNPTTNPWHAHNILKALLHAHGITSTITVVWEDDVARVRLLPRRNFWHPQ